MWNPLPTWKSLETVICFEPRKACAKPRPCLNKSKTRSSILCCASGNFLTAQPNRWNAAPCKQNKAIKINQNEIKQKKSGANFIFPSLDLSRLTLAACQKSNKCSPGMPIPRFHHNSGTLMWFPFYCDNKFISTLSRCCRAVVSTSIYSYRNFPQAWWLFFIEFCFWVSSYEFIEEELTKS